MIGLWSNVGCLLSNWLASQKKVVGTGIHMNLHMPRLLLPKKRAASCCGCPPLTMARRAPLLLSLGLLACGLLTLNSAFVAPASKPALRGQEAAIAGVLAALPASPAFATDQPSDSFSKVEIVAIAIPLVFWWIAFLEWDSKQPDPNETTEQIYLGKTIDGPTPDQPAYFRRSPENG